MKKRLERIEIFKQCKFTDLFVIKLWYNCKFIRKTEKTKMIYTDFFRIKPYSLNIKNYGIINIKNFKKSYDRDQYKIEFILKSKDTYDYEQGNYT